MNVLKQITVIVAYLALLITMVKQSKKNMQKLAEMSDSINATTEGIDVEVDQATGTVIGHEVNSDPITIVEGQVVGNVAGDVDATASTGDEVVEEVTSASTETVPVAPIKVKQDKKVDFYKVDPKNVKVSDVFVRDVEKCTEARKKEMLKEMQDEMAVMATKCLHLEDVLKVKDNKKKGDSKVENFNVVIQYEQEVKTLETKSDETMGVLRDEACRVFGIKKTHFRDFTLMSDGIDICASSRAIVRGASATKQELNITEGSVLVLLKYQKQ